MNEAILNAFAQYGLAGLVILALMVYVHFQSKARDAERREMMKALELMQDRLDKQNELLFDTIRNNTEKLIEFKVSLDKFIESSKKG